MGNSRVSIRTLANGEKVYHYPPDEEFPEGRTVLIGKSDLADSLEDRRADNEEAVRDLRVINQAKVEVKKEAEANDPSVPPEKRFI